VDELRKVLVPQSTLSLASPAFSLFAFAELRDQLEKLVQTRLVLPLDAGKNIGLLGSALDRPFRNRLQARWLARQCADWIKRTVEVRAANGALPQATLITDNPNPALRSAITGNCPFTSDGLGLVPGNQFSLIQCSENSDECSLLGAWF
jgi:hypothetical protein